MLEDHKRTGAYYQAVMQNRRQFEGRTVLDVGTGSGILAIFAARAGARKVYAVEATAMAKFARQLVEHNKVLPSPLLSRRQRMHACGAWHLNCKSLNAESAGFKALRKTPWQVWQEMSRVHAAGGCWVKPTSMHAWDAMWYSARHLGLAWVLVCAVLQRLPWRHGILLLCHSWQASDLVSSTPLTVDGS